MIHMIVAGMDVIGFFNFDEPIYMDDIVKANGRYYRVNNKRRFVDQEGNVIPVLDTSMPMRVLNNEDSES